MSRKLKLDFVGRVQLKRGKKQRFEEEEEKGRTKERERLLTRMLLVAYGVIGILLVAGLAEAVLGNIQ